MALPVVVVTSGGLPIQLSTTAFGLPVELSTLPGALPCRIVTTGGVPCLDVVGTVFGGGGSLTAPVLAWTSANTVAVAVFQIIIPASVPSGYKIQGEASLTSGGTAFETISEVISAGDLSDLQIDTFAFSAFPDNTTIYVRVRILTDLDVVASNWSNVVSMTMDLSGSTFFWLGF